MMAPRNAYYNSQQTTEQRESTKVSLKWSRKVMHTLIDIHRAERTYTKHPADFKMRSRGVFHHTHTQNRLTDAEKRCLSLNIQGWQTHRCSKEVFVTNTQRADSQMQERGVCH